MGRSKLDNPILKKKVIQRLAIGETQAEIAKDAGVDRSQVCRFSKREDVKALIEKEQFRLAEAIPDAVDNVKSLVREMPEIPPEETKRRELSYKATADLLRASGLFPSPIQSQTMVNIFSRETRVVSPMIEQLLKQIVQGPSGGKDTEIVEDAD